MSLYPVRVQVRALLFHLFRRATGKFPSWSAQLGGGLAPVPSPFRHAVGDAPGRGSFLAG